MKTLLNTTLLFLLVIGFSGGVSGQDVSDFEETKRLAEQGEAYAQYNLGLMYDEGEGVPENNAEAVRWYRLAAEQGYARAQSDLGFMYSNGEGVPQNNVRAYIWYSVAAAQGNETARTNRDIISERLTPDQLARGQDIATRCFESDYQDCE
jgi:hypothetical protein